MKKNTLRLRPNVVKQAAANGTEIRGCHLTFAAPPVIEVLASLELDFVYIDGEHGTFDFKDIEVACLAAERHDIIPIARVPDRTAPTITRFLDRGVRGIVVPHVDSVADAAEALDAVYFSPTGSRSFGGGRPFFQAIDDLPKHLEDRNNDISVGIMIESLAGLEAAEAIAALPGVDYLSFGLNDLAQALGYPGQPGHEEVARQVKEASQRIRRAGKPIREDFMKIAWINQVLLAGMRELMARPIALPY
jgi:2-keto-3-deoxy-L-rhamnonate aldolase RhmA